MTAIVTILATTILSGSQLAPFLGTWTSHEQTDEKSPVIQLVMRNDSLLMMTRNSIGSMQPTIYSFHMDSISVHSKGFHAQIELPHSRGWRRTSLDFTVDEHGVGKIAPLHVHVDTTTPDGYYTSGGDLAVHRVQP